LEDMSIPAVTSDRQLPLVNTVSVCQAALLKNR